MACHGEPALSVRGGDRETAERGEKAERRTAQGPDTESRAADREKACSCAADRDDADGDAPYRDAAKGRPPERHDDANCEVADGEPTARDGAGRARLQWRTDSNVNEGKAQKRKRRCISHEREPFLQLPTPRLRAAGPFGARHTQILLPSQR